jgi:hypothetical protein
VWERREMHTEFWWGNLKDRNNLRVLEADGRIVLKSIIKKQGGRAWTGFTKLWFGTSSMPW